MHVEGNDTHRAASSGHGMKAMNNSPSLCAFHKELKMDRSGRMMEKYDVP